MRDRRVASLCVSGRRATASGAAGKRAGNGVGWSGGRRSAARFIAGALVAVCVLRGGAVAGRDHPTEAKLIAPDAAAVDLFGDAVAIDGDLLVVGAPRHDLSGAVYVYENVGGTWTYRATLQAADRDPDVAAMFGTAVAVSGGTIVIGAPEFFYSTGSSNWNGAVYIFEKVGETWTQVNQFTPHGDEYQLGFGRSVSIHNDRIVACAPPDRWFGSFGYVYVFEKSGGAWAKTARIDPPGGENNYGRSVCVHGDRIAVGNGDRSVDPWYESVMFYVKDGDVWTSQSHDLRQDKAYFGNVFSLEGDAIAVAASTDKAVYLYDNYTSDLWRQEAKFTLDGFGADSVALNGDTLLIGAGEITCQGVDSGAVYVYTRFGDQWFEKERLVPDAPEADDGFGESVAISGDVVVVGCPRDDDAAENAGAVHLFKKPPPSVTSRQVLDHLLAIAPLPSALLDPADANHDARLDMGDVVTLVTLGR